MDQNRENLNGLTDGESNDVNNLSEPDFEEIGEAAFGGTASANSENAVNSPSNGENTCSSDATEAAVAHGDTNDSGAYTWQNPNPYNGYNGYSENVNTATPQQAQPAKKKLNGTVVALIGVSSVAFILMLAVIVMFFSLTSDRDTVIDTQRPQISEKDEPSTDSENKQETVDLPSLETQAPTNGELTVPQIYRKVKDSVVGIIVTATNGSQISQGSGTGIILSEDGYIATNAHVVSDATTIKVVLTDESEYTAELIGSDDRTDLAVLKIEKTGLQAAEFGDSDELVVGETVVAIGNPYGLELAGTVTSGIVSALNRRIAIENVYMTLIQTDASINPGNSGGPLVNAYGQVVGITSSKIVTTGYEGIGFAIPITGATDIISELIQFGYIKDRPYIGIQGSDLDASYAQLYNIPQGVYVQYVDPESDAYAKGLKKGDIIISVNGNEIGNMAELDEQKNNFKPGDSITLGVYRNTRKIEITITLSESTGN